MELGLRLRTLLFGECVGEDTWGNRYYRQKGGGRRLAANNNRNRRWVIYNGESEASRVPPGWHAWLHHTSDELPNAAPGYVWEKPPKANLSGTDQAWRRHGSLLGEAERREATGDYQAWNPDETTDEIPDGNHSDGE